MTYHYTPESGFDPAPEYVGVIAQELQQVAPYMVSVSKKVLEDGSSGYLQVDMSATTFMLINSIKVQQATIDALRAEVGALKSIAAEQEEIKKQLAQIMASLKAEEVITVEQK